MLNFPVHSLDAAGIWSALVWVFSFPGMLVLELVYDAAPGIPSALGVIADGTRYNGASIGLSVLIWMFIGICAFMRGRQL